MARLIWSPHAAADLEAIHDMIAREAPRTAERFLKRFFDRVESLEQFPLSGAIVPEIGMAQYREVRVKKYRIIYHVLEEDVLEIVTVHHGSRLLDWPALLED